MLDNKITTIISVLALLLSIINAIYIYYCNHKRIKIKLNSYTKNFVDGKNVYIFDLFFENKSRLPIAINALKIINNKKEYIINTNPKLICEITSTIGKTITGKSDLYSSEFPINIRGLNTNREFFQLIIDDNIEGDCVIKLFTNRGKVSKTVNIDDSYINFISFEKEYKDFVKKNG